MATEPSNDKVQTDTAETPDGHEPGVRRRRRPEDEGPEASLDSSADGDAEVPATPEAEPAEDVGAPAPPEPAPAEAAPAPAAKAKHRHEHRRAGPPRKVEDDDLDFGAMLDAGEMRDQAIEQGTIVEGRIVAFSDDWAFVDLGAKTEGVLAADEIRDANGQFTHALGDSIETFVVSTSGGEIKLSFALGRQIRDTDTLLDAYDAGMPVEGKVVGTNKGGFDVRIGGRRAFCPISQIDLEYTEDPSVHVGRTYTFRLKEVSENGKRIVVSRADYLREQRDAARKETLEHLNVGEELAGTVTSVQEYGAFVDIGGIEGLVHISELSWSRVEHPSEVVKPGDEITVKILSIKDTEKGQRIGLSLRETTPHPWIQVGTKFVEGESYTGTVTRLEPYGAFVELGPGVEGLVHVSELSWHKRISHPGELLAVGQPLEVYLKSVDEQRHRLALSVKALERNPWQGASTRFPAGSQVQGTVERVQPFGVFVEVEPGLTALIPASESNTGSGTDLRREFEIGKQVSATVLAVDEDRKRMSLSLKAAVDLKDEAELKSYFESQKKSQEQQGGSGFGTLGDLFKNKLK